MVNSVVGDVVKFKTPKDDRQLTRRSKKVQLNNKIDRLTYTLKEALDFIDHFVDNYYDLGDIDTLHRRACDLGDDISNVLNEEAE